MSEIVKGFVAKINKRQVNTRRGQSTSYSVRLEREDGSEIDKWFSIGFKAPEVSEGDYVKLEYETNERGFHDAKYVKALKNGPVRSEKDGGGHGTSGAGGAGSRSSGGGNRDAVIHYQSSRRDAIELVGLLISVDALPVTEAKTKAGTSKRYEEVVALVNKLTVQFFFDVETLRLTKSVADAGAVKADEDGELPDDEDGGEGADSDGDDDEEDDE